MGSVGRGWTLPGLIIELLSDSTAEVDRTEKKRLYQTIFHTPEYCWFSPITGELAGFRLNSGWHLTIPADERGWRWSNMLELYLGVINGQLRYFETDGTLVLGPAEAALQERQQAMPERERAEQGRERAEQEREHAEQEWQRTNREQQRADRRAQRLRDLGVDPEG